MNNQVNFILFGGQALDVKPWVIQRPSNVKSIAGVPSGYYVGIQRGKTDKSKIVPLKVGDRVAARHILWLVREQPEAGITVTLEWKG